MLGYVRLTASGGMVHLRLKQAVSIDSP